MAPVPKTKTKGGRSALADVVAREYTIHLHKRVRLSQLFRGYWLSVGGRKDGMEEGIGAGCWKRGK